jgi:hypothetical protein
MRERTDLQPAECGDALRTYSRRKIPLLRGGVDAPIKQMQRYLNIGAAGERHTPVLQMRKLNTDLANIPPN